MRLEQQNNTCQLGHLMFTELFSANVWLLLSRTVETQFCDSGCDASPGVERESPQSSDSVVYMAIPKRRGRASGDPPVGYSSTRSGSHAKKFSEGYSGYLETDSNQAITICLGSGAALLGVYPAILYRRCSKRKAVWLQPTGSTGSPVLHPVIRH